MRKILILISIILFSLTSYSQDNLNCFKISDGKLEWQEIFDTPMSFDEVVLALKETGVVENIEIGECKIIGQLKSIHPDYEGAGITFMHTPPYVSEFSTTGVLKIDYKENRYRVTLKQMTVSKMSQSYGLEFFGLKKRNTKFTNHFANKGSRILNYTFGKIFTFSNNVDNEDW